VTGRLRIGTRGSPLALAQTELVVRGLRRFAPRTTYEIVPISTRGDRIRRSAPALDFTDEIDRQLESGAIDLAVHSAKDLPARPQRAVHVAAYPRRADPRDCLVLRSAGAFASLPRGARIGSSSLRRRAQLLSERPDIEVVPLRGNVGTRLEQVRAGGLDGVMLAAAGLERLGWGDRITEYLPLSRWLPAPAQGTLAVEVRDRDREAHRAVVRLDHAPTRAAAEAERAVVRALGGDCDLPLGALARVRGPRLTLRAELFSVEGRLRIAADGSGDPGRAVRIGERVGSALRTIGGPRSDRARERRRGS